MLAPQRIWWKPFGRLEKTWLTVAFVWCVFLTLMMPLRSGVGETVGRAAEVGMEAEDDITNTSASF